MLQAAAAIGQTAADKKWDVPGKKIANRKGRPEPKKKKEKKLKKKTAAAAAAAVTADETSERRKSIVSHRSMNLTFSKIAE